MVQTAAPPPSAIAYRIPEEEAAPEPAPPAIKPLAPPIEQPRVVPAPAPAPLPIPQAPPRRGFPVWLAFVLSTLAVAGVVLLVYWVVNRSHETGGTPVGAEQSQAAKPGATVSPLQKYIEVSSVRFLEDPKDKQKVLVKFVLTNHSGAELNGLAGNVNIWASTGRSEEDAEGSFEFKTDVKGGESKELTAPLASRKKIYELPDWQNMTNDVQITAPTF
jgi:hypothetical protein